MLSWNRLAIVAAWTIVAVFVFTNTAMAYIGPGGGMEFFGYALGLIAMLGAAFASFVLWPFYKFLGWLRGTKSQGTAPPPDATAAVADASPPDTVLAPAENQAGPPTALVP